MSAPTHLPGFNALRSGILNDLGLTDFIAKRSPRTDHQIVAGGIALEPLFAARVEGGVDATGWLAEVLGDPTVPQNAAHLALAELSRRGARVWTVNFHPLIERSCDSALLVANWPGTPEQTPEIRKRTAPHRGSKSSVRLGGGGAWALPATRC